MHRSTPPAPEGVSIVLIAKNNAKIIPDLFDSLRPFLRATDEVVVVDTGSTDGTQAILEQYSGLCHFQLLNRPDLNQAGMLDLVKKYLPDEAQKCAEDPQFNDGFLADFAAARQIGTDAARHDLILWIDTDDVLEGGGILRRRIDEHFGAGDNRPLFLAYDYSFDSDGVCNTVLWRERICRRSLYRWAGVCHESMIPRSGQVTEVVRVPAEEARIVHKHGRHHIYSDIRNYAILRNAHEKAEWKDPRWEFYLGNACRGLRRWQEAIDWYARVLRRSGSSDDRLACALNIGFCFILFGRPWRALDWFFQAAKIDTNDPRPYYGMARAFFELKRYRDCLTYSQIGHSFARPQTITSIDPNQLDFVPAVFEVLSLQELGNIPGALAKVSELQRLRPNYEGTAALLQDIHSWARNEQLKGATELLTSAAFSREASLDMIKAIKPEIRQLIPELQVETYCTPPRNSVTFLCGQTFERWDATSLQDGVGGSEKMVILLAREFAKAGKRVDVYGHPKPENAYKTFDKVTYRPSSSFNPLLKRDTLIIWRHWGFLDAPLKARKIFLDLHDVQVPSDFKPGRLARLAGIFFKSNFHLDPVKAVCPPGLAIVTRNGTANPVGSAARNLRKIVFTSSGDRGLLRSLRIFARVRAIHPDSEFHSFYGFTPLYAKKAAEQEYQFFGDVLCERHMNDYAEDCFDLGTKVGARFHGRVGSDALAAELETSSIWLYPTRFPEISCISAMEAQAAGCLPVCTDYGALKETVDYGIRIPFDASDDAYIQAIDSIFKKGSSYDDYRKDCAKWAQEKFAVGPLAKEWLARFE